MAYIINVEGYREHQVRIAAFAKALSHPARIAIIELLYAKGGCYCGDIVSELPISQSSVSQHLKELKDAELITATDLPPKVKYCVNKENWELAKTFFCHFFDRH
ncbi:MAG: metalloregulator ArsR/SmtB family transcription factor [Thermoflexibacter sp.]|jgi:DNA-binding transcriptional ArsR family regulator|nr:metalloregulator ArsR/SmtB family transcription factor [Thermoflexibacter sp.]